MIPKINLEAPIVDVGWKVVDRGNRRFTEWETADDAAGRHINSAKPGEQGNVVLSGHHNTKGEVFRAISEGKLAVGDFIYLYDDQGKRVTYVVDEVTKPLLEVGATEEQRLANAQYIQPTSDAASDTRHVLAILHEHASRDCRGQAGSVTQKRKA